MGGIFPYYGCLFLRDLEGACITGDSSYEKRKKARDAEIEALQKAQTFLEDAFKEKASSRKVCAFWPADWKIWPADWPADHVFGSPIHSGGILLVLVHY